MPYWRLYYHITWATRDRRPLIGGPWREQLLSVTAAKAVKLGAIVHAAGGTSDHVHIALSAPPSATMSRLVGELKGSSSHFVNHELDLNWQFSWQSSYGVTSFSEEVLPRVVAYVNNQEKHHGAGQVVTTYERTEPEAGPQS